MSADAENPADATQACLKTQKVMPFSPELGGRHGEKTKEDREGSEKER
jgi:hypothetical protein